MLGAADTRVAKKPRTMVKYSLGDSFACQRGGAARELVAGLREREVQWKCPECGLVNGITINTTQIRIGSRLLLAAKRSAESGDFDVAAILLTSAVDASLGAGVRDLTIWRAIEALEVPPSVDDLERSVARMRYSQKLAEFERLAGASLKEGVLRLRESSAIGLEDLPLYGRLVEDLGPLSRERNRLVHMGMEVDSSIGRASVPVVERAVTPLESMFHSAFVLEDGASGARPDGSSVA